MMKRKTKLDDIPEAIRYLCLAVVFVLGLFSITATGGGGGDDSSGSSSGAGLLSEARVTVLSTATATGIQGARVEGRFLDTDTNFTETSSCRTDANGKCIVIVEITGQLADEVTLTVSQTDFYTTTDKTPLDSTGSVNVIVYMTPK
jgi:hypothetical protein